MPWKEECTRCVSEREAAVSRRIARVPEAACGGVKDVLAVCGQDTKVSQAAQQRDSLLLRFTTEDEVSALGMRACVQFMKLLHG